MTLRKSRYQTQLKPKKQSNKPENKLRESSIPLSLHTIRQSFLS